VGQYRETDTYDANGNMLSWLEEQWTNGQWVNSSRGTYTYDANGKLTSSLSEQWMNGQWVGQYRETYTYDANGNTLSWLDEEWNYYQQWVSFARGTYTYDALGRQTSYFYESVTNGQWVNNGRETSTYDANGNRLSYLNEHWMNGQWVNTSLNMKTYDAQENLTSEGFYRWLNSYWSPDDGSIYGYVVLDSAGNVYGLGRGYSFIFVRRLTVTGVASQSGSGPASYSLSQNYPNPFNPTTEIGFQISGFGLQDVRLLVYDVLGREVATLMHEPKAPGSYTVRFDAKGLASGVYFYRLSAGDFVETKRLLVLK
jgi:hypothetical protein